LFYDEESDVAEFDAADPDRCKNRGLTGEGIRLGSSAAFTPAEFLDS
jgi:hypothetical protein